jgi:predicted PurR-regulated permease PerM
VTVRRSSSAADVDRADLLLRRPPAERLALVALAIFALIFFLRYAGDVVIPVVIAVFVSYAFEPMVAWLAHAKIPRPLGAALLLLGVLGTIDDLPAAARKVGTALHAARTQEGTPLQKVEEVASQIEKSATEVSHVTSQPGMARVQVQERPLNIRGYLWTGSMGVLGLLTQGVLLLFLVYFVLVGGDLFKRKLVAIAGRSFTQKRLTVEILNEITLQLQRYFLVLLVSNVVVGVASWLAFRGLGLRRAASLGVVAGVFHTVPYVGPLIVSAGVALVAFLELGALRFAAFAGTLELGITGLVGFLLVPWLVGRTARMNEVAVFVGLLFWAWMWGIVGMLLAVPLMVTVKAVCDRVEGLGSVGELLGE